MCGSLFGGKPSIPKPEPVAAPQVAATPPPAEPVAEAPVTNEGAKRNKRGEAQRRGTSALKINLNIGGGNMGAAGGTSGLSIPQ